MTSKPDGTHQADDLPAAQLRRAVQNYGRNAVADPDRAPCFVGDAINGSKLSSFSAGWVRYLWPLPGMLDRERLAHPFTQWWCAGRKHYADITPGWLYCDEILPSSPRESEIGGATW